jgi:hypothetical protein
MDAATCHRQFDGHLKKKLNLECCAACKIDYRQELYLKRSYLKASLILYCQVIIHPLSEECAALHQLPYKPIHLIIEMHACQKS